MKIARIFIDQNDRAKKQRSAHYSPFFRPWVQRKRHLHSKILNQKGVYVLPFGLFMPLKTLIPHCVSGHFSKRA